MLQAMLKTTVEKRRTQNLPSKSCHASRHNKTQPKEDPELIASHRHIESMPTSRAIPPKEDLKAD